MKSIKNISQLRVRYAETDKMGVVYNANYLVYFETGRNALMRANGLPYTFFESIGYYFPLIDAYAKYYISAAYDDLLDIETEFTFENSPIIKINYKIFREGNLLCEGYTRHTFVSQSTMKPVRPPKQFAALFKQSL